MSRRQCLKTERIHTRFPSLSCLPVSGLCPWGNLSLGGLGWIGPVRAESEAGSPHGVSSDPVDASIRRPTQVVQQFYWRR